MERSDEFTTDERIFCWQFFSAFFRGDWNEAVEQAAQGVVQALGAALPDADAVRMDQEWARLFYGVGPETVTLTESSWTNALRLHCQAPFHAALADYARCGIASEADDLPADHLAVMAGFIAWKLRNRQDPSGFFAEHLAGPWIAGLIAALRDRFEEPAHQAVLNAFEAFMAAERKILLP